uniref:Uncharacterized protein n=1 Tax=Arcella intermedia TaxID=1963864 RepID=A0A6B2L165_9EUKA
MPMFQLYNFIENYEIVYYNDSKMTPVNERESVEEDEMYNGKALGFYEPKPNLLEKPLIDVWNNYSTFVLEHTTALEEKTVLKMRFGEHPDRPTEHASSFYYSLNPRGQFMTQFHAFTNNQFQNFRHWDNMIIVGGAIVASALPVPTAYEAKLEHYFHRVAYQTADIDIYFYGLSTGEFKRKLEYIYRHLLTIHPKVAIVRTPNTVTFCTEYPNRHIQIVLGKWKSIAEILFEPDIDCTCLAFDGKRLWSTQRARLSFNWRVVNCTQRAFTLRSSPQYEERLVKYSRRGFYIIDKKLDWNKISTYFIRMGKKRIIEENNAVWGLRLIICGYLFPDVYEKKSAIFNPPPWKDTGLVYGPKWTYKSLTDLLNKNKMLWKDYPALANDFRRNPLQLVELKDLNFELSETKNRFTVYHWYEYLLKVDDEKEQADRAKGRVNYKLYVLELPDMYVFKDIYYDGEATNKLQYFHTHEKVEKLIQEVESNHPEMHPLAISLLHDIFSFWLKEKDKPWPQKPVFRLIKGASYANFIKEALEGSQQEDNSSSSDEEWSTGQ